jgi:hypothetical protein
MKTKTITTTRYTTDLGVELSFKPAKDDDVIVTKKDGKLYVRYLVQDENTGTLDNPNDHGAPDLFLVNYHRDFKVTMDKSITKDDVREFYVNSTRLPTHKSHWTFKLNCYIHSGVVLGLAPTNFPDEQWDVSHVGLVLVSKKIWRTEVKAKEVAESFVKEWNQYLSGDIWGMCTDVFDSTTKQRIDKLCEATWGCYDYNYCLKELKKESEAK